VFDRPTLRPSVEGAAVIMAQRRAVIGVLFAAAVASAAAAAAAASASAASGLGAASVSADGSAADAAAALAFADAGADADDALDASASPAVAAAEDAADAALAAACTTGANAAWGALLAAHGARHARGLAALEAGAAAVAALPPAERPKLSVYVVRPRESQVGLGDIVAGLSNVFLSALRRGRVLLVEWEGSAAALGPPRAPFARDAWASRARWERLAAALGVPGNRSEAVWRVERGKVQGSALTWPPLWRGGGGRGKALEVHEHFNRGAFTPDGGAAAPGADAGALAWLERTLPRAADGALAYGCVYRAAFGVARRLRVRAAQLVPQVLLPPPRPAAPSDTALPPVPPTPLPLLCAHVRTWVFRPELPQESRDIVRGALRCAEHALRLRGNASTPLLLAADNAAARRAFREQLGAARVLAIADAPAHVGYKEGASDAEIEDALDSTVLDWHLLSRCHHGVVMAYNTGFSRTAAAAAQAPLFIWRGDEEVEEEGAAPCGVLGPGPAREANRGVGCGW